MKSESRRGVNGAFGKNRLPLPPGGNRIVPVKTTARQRLGQSQAILTWLDATWRLGSAVRAASGWPSGRFSAVAGLCSLMLLFCGCSSFNRDWRRAATQPVPPASVEGRWEGRWVSEVNGHHGRLRCLMMREGEDRCQARFRATYGGLFHFSYTVPLELQPHDVGWEVNGEANLGKLAGGNYYYEGRIAPTNFTCTYRSKYDHGIFELRRPE